MKIIKLSIERREIIENYIISEMVKSVLYAFEDKTRKMIKYIENTELFDGDSLNFTYKAEIKIDDLFLHQPEVKKKTG